MAQKTTINDNNQRSTIIDSSNQNNIYFDDMKMGYDQSFHFHPQFLNVGRQQAFEKYKYAPHCHVDFEFIYLVDGVVEYMCDDKKFIAKQGDCYIIQPSQVHIETGLSDRLDFIYIKLLCRNSKGKPIQSLISNIENQFFASVENNVKQFFLTIFKEASERNFGFRQIIDSELMKLMIVLLRKVGKSSEIIEGKKSKEIIIDSVVRDLNNNLQNTVSVDELAKKYNISRSYLMHAFKQVCGESIKSFSMQIKISEAQKLLTKTLMNINEIASMLGFNSPFYFSKRFSESVGMTPSEYRARHKQG